VLALGGPGAAFAVTLFVQTYWIAVLKSVLSYALIGLAVGASDTSLLAAFCHCDRIRQAGCCRDDRLADDELWHCHDG